jgi:inosose dehydratase
MADPIGESHASAARDPEHFRLRVGTAPVNWNNFDLPGWRPVVPFPEILDAMRDAGYTDTEWDESFGADPDALNRERLTRGMAFMGAYRWLDFVDAARFQDDLDVLENFLGILRQIGAAHLIVADRLRPERVACAGAVPQDGSRSLDGAGYSAVASNLSRLADVAARYDLAVHYHNHAGTYVETPTELECLVAAIEPGSVDLCFDTGHFAYGGGDSLTFLREHLNAVGYLHLKDVDADVLDAARRHGWSFQDALRHYIFCPLGDGNARIGEIVSTLRQARYAGWVIIEQDTCRGDSTANAHANLAAVRRFEESA